jgi:hypothetical protein
MENRVIHHSCIFTVENREKIGEWVTGSNFNPIIPMTCALSVLSRQPGDFVMKLADSLYDEPLQDQNKHPCCDSEILSVAKVLSAQVMRVIIVAPSS